MVTKAHIIAEIERTARANRGMPLGKQRFYSETGIKESDWLGKYWARWSDALREVGFAPNTLQVAYGEEVLLERLAAFARELGRFPGRTDMQLKGRVDETFPDPKTFQRLGRKSEVAAKLAKYCESQGRYDDVVQMCAAVPAHQRPDTAGPTAAEEAFGYVYLLRSGRFYKVGRSNAVGRRERELAIQLPERAVVVHSIKTDDPVGIEHYWHSRFEDRHKNGEWFELTAQDVAAFKRRKFM